MQIKHVDFFANLLINAAFDLLSQRPLINQIIEPVRQGKMLVPRIVREVFAHGVDHMRVHVETHHVQRAKRGAFRASKIAPGERIHRVEA